MKRLMSITSQIITILFIAFFLSSCGSGGSGGGTSSAPTPTYTVTYNGNGNTGGSVPIDSTNYVQGQTVTVLGNTGSLVKTNYSFAGWNTQADGSGTTYSQAQTFTMGAANVILYANWTGTATVTLSSITVTPANPTIAPGLTQQFTATGHYSDGSTQDITMTAIWSSSTTSVAVISNATGSNGLATAVAAGSSTITATSGSIPGSTTLTVNAVSGGTTYIYYSSTVATAQTATLDANGTLTMDGLKLTGFSFGASASDASGTLTSWAAPLSNVNQPNVPVMLFCGSNNKLAYVLLLSDANDPNRTTSSVVNLLSAVESASQYSGIGVYTDCSGTFTSAWNNNLPNSDYYLWPNVLNTYSYAYVASELNNAFIFYESGQTSNPDNYLAVTWKGTTSFEVWK